MSTDDRCCQCGKINAQLLPADDLRPYGPDGAPICHRCAHSTPELEAEAHMRGVMHGTEVALAMIESTRVRQQ